MTDLRQQLRDADPIRTEGGMSAVDVARVRMALLDVQLERATTSWLAFASVAAGLVCVVTAGVWSVERGSRVTASNPPSFATAEPEAEGVRRQVYFSTPGGTRVVWQFNPAFELR